MVRSYNTIITKAIEMSSPHLHHQPSWNKRSLKNLFRSHSHRLFGNALTQLSTEEDLIPKPIQVRLTC